MMVEPAPEALIRRICDTLQQSVLAGLPPESMEHRQLKAALFALRHVAGQLEGREARLAAEIGAMAELLGPAAPSPVAGASLARRHVALQEALLAWQEGPEVDEAALRRLYRQFS